MRPHPHGGLVSEITMTLEQLHNNTKVGLTSFSSGGYRNNKEWSESANGLVRVGDAGKRESAFNL